MAIEVCENWEAPYKLHYVPLLQNLNARLHIIICYEKHTRTAAIPGQTRRPSDAAVSELLYYLKAWPCRGNEHWDSITTRNISMPVKCSGRILRGRILHHVSWQYRSTIM